MNFIGIFYLLTLLWSFEACNEAKDYQKEDIDTARVSQIQQENWVDSVISLMGTEEKIAQLIFIRAYSNKDKGYAEKISRIIKTYKPGGITFFQGNPSEQVKLTNTWQQDSKVPLFVSIDAEWGLGMRLKGGYCFPYQMTLGAIQDHKLIYKMGRFIALDCKNIGVQINFAPVIDVNVNPDNPVINYRSFGEDKENVAQKGIAYMQGLQSENVIATAKHFPGHGDTDKDSHHTLPLINHNKKRLHDIELYPFQQLFNEGIQAVMVAHLFIPSLDSSPDLASTLSRPIVTDLLQEEMGFKGLVITDALEMRGVADYFEAGELEVKALEAGNDILLLPEDIEKSIQAIKNAIEDDRISMDIIDQKCRKVLGYKYNSGLAAFQPPEVEGLEEKLNSAEHNSLNFELYASAVSLVKNNNSFLPLRYADTMKMASVSIGSIGRSIFQKRLSDYADVHHYQLKTTPNMYEVNALINDLKGFDLIIIGIHSNSNSPRRNFGISQRAIDFINLLRKDKKLVIDFFSNPYALERISDLDNIEALIVSYENHPYVQDASAQLIFGGLAFNGKLPVSSSAVFLAGMGVETRKTRLSFGFPEQVGVKSEYLNKIDTLALQGIREMAYPGCQILVAKQGMIIYNKTFGYHTYDRTRPVQKKDMYDVASITKIAATTMAVMRLSDEGKLDIDKQLKDYLPETTETDKGELIIRDILAHQARLTPWIPFFLKVLNDSIMTEEFLYETAEGGFVNQVAENLYIKEVIKDSIFHWILQSELLDYTEYKYSDLGFILLKEIIERICGQAFDEYMSETFYSPLGLQHTSFNPFKKLSADCIPPTEMDTVFRKQTVRAFVHDQAAAMLGGVSGHAGLFMNAEDLAVLMQMLLQKGHYGHQRFLDAKTIDEFTHRQFPLDKNRRGLGFDKSFPEYKDYGPVCKSASPNSYGHSGFTGTYVWVDPDYDLIYVFLSNRIYPYTENKMIYKLNTRTEIQQLIYDAIEQSQ